MVTIRKATLKDLKAIQDLSKALIIKEKGEYDSTLVEAWPHSRHGKRAYVKNITKGFAVIAEEKKSIIGYATGNYVKEQPYREGKHKIELENIFIMPAHRSKGIGAKFINAFKKWGKEKKADALYVRVSYYNTKGLKFYKQHGFKPLGTRLEINPKNKHAK